MRIVATSDIVREHFAYSGGKLYWVKPTTSRVAVGAIAGTVRKDGYVKVGFLGKDWLLHRLIFLYHHGYLPELIDHINQDNTDNRIENLRGSDKRGNVHNTGLAVNNTSGIRGVSWSKQMEMWTARFKHNGKYLFLGYYEYSDDAKKARQQAEEKYL